MPLPSFAPPGLPADLDPGRLAALRADVRAFLAAERAAGRFKPGTSGWITFDATFSRRCGAAGLIGITWPTAYGGQARSMLERHVVVEELLAAGAPVGAHWIADRQSGPQILKHGSESLKRRLLPGIARGECFFAIGMSEPDAGSDLAAIRSTATRVAGGWRLDGRKLWTTNGHRAHFMIGLFRTAPRDAKARHAGMTQFVVELDAAGIERRALTDITGASDFSEIIFEGAFVPDANVLGEPGRGWALVLSELAYERSGPERFLSVIALLAAAVADTGPQPGELEARELGRIAAHVAALRQMSASVAGELAAGRLPNVEAALVKDLGNAHEQETVEILARLFGARAVGGNDPLAVLLRAAIQAAPSFTLRGGTPEVLRGIIARELGLR